MAVNKVIYGGETLIDTSGVTVTPETLAEGETALNAAGEEITGTMKGLPDYTTTDNGKFLGIEEGNPAWKKLEDIALIKNLSDWYDENHYVNMTGTFTATNSGGTFEIGRTVKSKFTWDFSKLPTTLTVGGVSTTPTQKGETDDKSFTSASQGSKTFTISGVYAGTYGNETVSKTWTYTFQNKRYWGVEEAPTSINSEFIKGLSKNEFATSRTKTFNLNDSTDTKYIWYAYPTRFGEASFSLGGFAGGFESPTTVSFDNGYTSENYYVYRSTLPGVGKLEVVVK